MIESSNCHEKLFFTAVFITILSGCAYSINEIDVTKTDPICTRQCTATYSSCVSGGNQVGLKQKRFEHVAKPL
jgi:uncharacterized lipoprotein YajG